MHTLALPPWLVLGLVAAVFATALWKGGPEERATAGVLIGGWAITLIFRDRHWSDPQWVGFGVDIATLLFLGVMALRTHQFWPLFAAAFQLLGVVTHTARIIDTTLGEWAYITGGVIFSYLVLAALAGGTWEATRRRREAAPGAGD